MILSLALSFAIQTANAAPPAAAPLTVEVHGVRPPAPARRSPAVVEVGKKIYGARCTGCHGATGNSDGPVGKALKPTPQRFTDALWAARVTDEEIATAIKEGGLAVKKSAAMPAHRDLNAEQIAGLTAFVRTLQSPWGTASVTVMTADGRDLNGAGDADASGTARVLFKGVSGKVIVLGVIDSSGAPACQIDVPEAAGAVVRCTK